MAIRCPSLGIRSYISFVRSVYKREDVLEEKILRVVERVYHAKRYRNNFRSVHRVIS